MNLLVIAAHADDEVLLGGGTIHKATRRGHNAAVVFCTHNDQGRWGEESVPDRRARAEAEAQAAGALLGFDHRFLEFEDMALADQPGRTLRALIDLLRDLQPDIVITHSPGDWHSDHRALGQLVPEAALQSGNGIGGGSVRWRPGTVLHGEVDLEALGSFAFHAVSRLEERDLAAKVAALRIYRTIAVDHSLAQAGLDQLIGARAQSRGRLTGVAAGEAFSFSPLVPMDGSALRAVAEMLD